jgi:CubicO group peptidase (beta-lactamase class C family)
MNSSRREVLGLAMGGVMAGALPASAAAALPSRLDIQTKGRDYAAALTKLRDYAAAELAAVGQPGMTIAIVDADGFAATIGVGWANIEAKVPVGPDHLFQIGSISKSITALCIHSLVDEGRIDLNAPVSRYLEGAPLPETPITIQQLLDHAGGFAHDAPVFPDTPDGKLWCGFTPGSRASYSNIGFLLLGLVIDKVTGRPHPEVIHERVQVPLGMVDATAHLMTADRSRYATGYTPFIEDRPVMTRPLMFPGPFAEGDFASGAVGASGKAMLGYLRYVIALGRGKGGPILSDARAKALLASDVPLDEFGPEARYASGFAKVDIDGKPALHHTGGMVLFTSSFHVDPAAGVGCFASVNGRIGPYRPRKTTQYAVQLMRAVRAGKPLPDAPDPLAYRKIEKPAPYLGRWVGPGDRALELKITPAGLTLIAGGTEARVEASGENTIITDHPLFDRHLLIFEMDDGHATGLWWGDTLFGKGSARQQPTPDPSLLPLAGLYSSGDAWSRALVTVRGKALYLEGAGELTRRADGYWSPRKDVGGITRIWFTGLVNGACYQLSYCGDAALRLR